MGAAKLNCIRSIQFIEVPNDGIHPFLMFLHDQRGIAVLGKGVPDCGSLLDKLCETRKDAVVCASGAICNRTGTARVIVKFLKHMPNGFPDLIFNAGWPRKFLGY